MKLKMIGICLFYVVVVIGGIIYFVMQVLVQVSFIEVVGFVVIVFDVCDWWIYLELLVGVLLELYRKVLYFYKCIYNVYFDVFC